MAIQVNLDIPPEIDAGLVSGDLIRIGGVVRDRTGNIVKHLKEVPSPATSREAVGRVAVNLKRPWAFITATALSAAAVGAAALIAARKRNQTGEPKMPECVEKYNASLRAYLEAVREGSLDAGIISQLISDLDAVEAYSGNDSIIVDFSTGQSETLANLVVDYTRKLGTARAAPSTSRAGRSGRLPSSAPLLTSWLLSGPPQKQPTTASTRCGSGSTGPESSLLPS